MPIGAVIGGAVIGAGGSIIAGSKSASAQKQAAQTAATSAQNTTDANNQLFRDTRAQNIAIAQPFYNNGVAAGNALQGLLLGSPAPATTTTTGALGGYQTNPVYGQPQPVHSGALASYYGGVSGGEYGGVGRRFEYDSPIGALNDGGGASSGYYGAPAAYSQQQPQSTVTSTPTATSTTPALSPWDQFRNSTNYQWRYDQGLKATQGAYATKGALDSGAAEKAKITFGQNFASNELSNYMNLLAQQQNVGLSAGNAIMGVSTSSANAIAGQNTNAGNVAANAALASGQANANMWGTIGNTAGQLGGALFQYGMGQFNQPAASWTPANLGVPSPVSFGSATPVASAPSSYGALGFGGF